MASVQQMKDVLERNLKAFTAGNWNGFKATLTDDAIYEEEATGRRVQGGDAAVQAVGPWIRAFPDMGFTIKEAIGSGDALVVELDWTGTHKGPLVGPFGSIPATGKYSKLPAVQVVRFDGDRIRELRHYFDLLTLLRNIGVAAQVAMPASAQP